MALLALVVIFAASACSVVGSPGSISAEWLEHELVAAAPTAEHEASTSRSGSRDAEDRPRHAAIRTASGAWLAEVTGSRLATSEEAADEPRKKVRTIRLKPRPRPGAFSMNLYEKGDFVHQATPYWCVSASVQTMINIVKDGKPRRSRAFQKRIHIQGIRMDEDDDDDDDPWDHKPPRARGLGLTDWADLLDQHGAGPYELDRAGSRRKAIRMAAKALRRTGRPVGLVVWRGAHAWVMSGFTATADPAFTNDFKVKAVYIQDVWYPYVSSIWGRSRPPDALVPVAALAADYLPYDRPGRRHPKRDGKFMLVLPTLPPDTRVR